MNLMLNKDTLKCIVLRSWVGRVFFFLQLFSSSFLLLFSGSYMQMKCIAFRIANLIRENCANLNSTDLHDPTSIVVTMVTFK